MKLDMHPGPAPEHGWLVHRAEHPSRADRRQELVDAYAERLQGLGWVAADEVNWLRLCLEEVFVNAMVHGNEGDPALPVTVSLRDDGAAWEMLVADRGDGFSASEVPDPEDAACLLYEHGRGILLMQGWLDAVSWYDSGATILMRRRKSGRAARKNGCPAPT